MKRLVLSLSLLLAACSGGDESPADASAGIDGALDAGGGEGGAGPVDAGREPCETPGESELVPCGRCGTIDRFCTALGYWAYGVCSGEGACEPGETRTGGACGLCGTTTETCTAACEWSAGECAGEGACAPGTRSRSREGCPAGQTREVVCSDACVLEPAGDCEADDCPTPGVLETVACGMCGTRERFCTAEHVWSYGTCGDEGACAPGATQMVSCGRCGTRRDRCTASCEWDTTGACTDEGACAPGESSRTTEGCAAGQSRPLSCDATCTFVPGTCETDECTPGATTTVACGRCGTRTRTCSASRTWVDGPCTGEGVCAPGEIGSQPCGRCGSQPTLCSDACLWEVTATCAGEGTCQPGASGACTTSCGSRGTQTCTAACTPGSCVPPAETCGDGDDDDCDGAVDDGCPACTPMSDVCPSGWTYSSDGTEHRCAITFTPPPGVRPYCLYSDMGYLGFNWQTPPVPPAYTCPPGARYALAAPSTGYCVWDGLTIPAGAVIECPVASGQMSFRWPCS